MSDAPGILYAGTPAFAVPPLQALIREGHRVRAVIAQPDRPAGRGRRLQSPPVRAAAETAGIPVLQPERLERRDLEAACAGSRPDLLVVVAYGQLLARPVLEFARLGAINVHASLLPRWRGAAPIARALEAGDAETGVSIMRMTEALDAGPVLLQRRCRVRADDTGETLHDRLAELGADALLAVLEDPAGHLDAARPQDDSRATYAPKLTRADGRIDWTAPAAAIERRVRAMQPWPCAWTALDGEPLRVLAAELLPATAAEAEPGLVHAAGRDGIDVGTGAGRLRLLRVQPASRRPMAAADLANSRDLEGCRLGA